MEALELLLRQMFQKDGGTINLESLVEVLCVVVLLLAAHDHLQFHGQFKKKGFLSFHFLAFRLLVTL